MDPTICKNEKAKLGLALPIDNKRINFKSCFQDEVELVGLAATATG